MRMAPLSIAAILVGAFRERLGFWIVFMGTVAIAAAYVWNMRPLYGSVLALDPRWNRWFALARLAPPVQAASSSAMPAVNQS